MIILTFLLMLGAVLVAPAYVLAQPGGSSGFVQFQQLIDTPASFAGAADQCVRVDPTETALVFAGCVAGSGQAVLLDLGDDASNESIDLGKIATTGDTNSIFTESAADKLLINLGNRWPGADTATQLAANGSNCTSGQAALGVNALGAAEGCFSVLALTAIDTESELESVLTDVTNVFTNNDGALNDDNLSNDNISALSNVNADANAADDEMMMGDGSSYRGIAVPNCTVGTEKLIYATATNTWSCETDSGAIILDIDDDASNESTNITEIATTGDNNSIFTESAADKLLIDASIAWLSADALTSTGIVSPGADGDSAVTVNASGLDLVSGKLSLLRGCADNEILKWDEVTDRWECATDSGAGGGGTLDESFDLGKVIDGANSQANAVVIGDGTDGFRFYVGTGGPIIECFLGAGTCDIEHDIASGNTFQLNYATTAGISIDSSFNVTLANNAKESHSIWIDAGAMSSDGTQCADPAEVTINSGPKTFTVVCTDSDAGTVYAKFVMPDKWDAGTLTVEPSIFSATGTPAGDYDIDWAMQCRDNSTVINNTFGSEIATDFDFDAAGTCGGSACVQYAVAQVTSAAITPDGTCAKGDLVIVRGQIDATGTTATVANVNILGIKVVWTADDWSD